MENIEPLWMFLLYDLLGHLSRHTLAVKTGLRRVDSLAAKCLMSRGRNKRAMVSRQKQEYQRQSRDVNNTRTGVEVTGTGSEFQGRAVQGQTQRWQEE